MFLNELRHCAIDSGFAADEALQRTTSGELALVTDEDRVWALLEALKPVCNVCLEDARHRRI